MAQAARVIRIIIIEMSTFEPRVLPKRDTVMSPTEKLIAQLTKILSKRFDQ
jgi:hypothetical protein